jgi:hypothetical protein
MKPAIQTLFCALLALLLAVPAAADGLHRSLPQELTRLFADQDLSVEINLSGFVLRMVAAATADEDEDFSRLLSGLESIQVRILEGGPTGPADLARRFDVAVRGLDRRGWQPMVKAHTDEGSSYIYLQEEKGKVLGLVVLFSDPSGDSGMVHIVGEMDPEELGRIGRRFDLPIPGEGEKKKE